MDDEIPFRGVGDVLDCLDPYGIYDAAIINSEMGTFGFAYDAATDQVTYRGGSVPLHAAYPVELERELRADEHPGTLHEGVPGNMRLVDAIALSAAIRRLLFPGQMIPSDGHRDRDDGYSADVAAILASEQPPN